MKNVVFIVLLTMISASLAAQIRNTKWKGTIHGDNPRNVIMDFHKDSVSLFTISDSSLVETMTYSVKDGIISLLKIEGQSDCDNVDVGKYRFRIKDGMMYMKLVSDPCPDRSSAIDSTKWFKWKKHPEVRVDPSVLRKYVGEYAFDAGHHLFVTLENGRLQIEGPNNRLPKSPLYPESDTRFFLKIAGVELDFVKNPKGEVVKMISHEENDYELKKIK
jgi:hypothetical protein